MCKSNLILILLILRTRNSFAQENTRSLRLGINYVVGKQQIFPYNSPDYIYNIKGYKIQFTYPLKNPGVVSFELQLEPGIFSARHQLLNEFFVQPEDGADFLEQREIFTKEKTITEYVLNFGCMVRYHPTTRLSLIIGGSVGPLFSDTKTERLAKGFAFADVVAIGLGYQRGRFLFEIKPGLRHVSNADLQYPNSGHNSSNIDFGISVIL